jgi:hypothetical protein
MQGNFGCNAPGVTEPDVAWLGRIDPGVELLILLPGGIYINESEYYNENYI